MKAMALILAALMLFTVACGQLHQQHYEGAGAGAVIGGIAGALLDKKNPWRGGVIGAGLGAVFGATIADISTRGSREAYQSGRPVEYRTEDGRGYYRAEPASDYYYKDPYTKCRKVSEKVWENGKLVKDTVKEICESEKQERTY
ncbi:MAG: glycine zipper 2TM domain-containing protein [Thermodesulfovibrio sp.]|uniref:glycine zipper 2TM domain-containing protein n=1 Tax=unclassified Thermodesulfovibrio TaxID=2645936 RepID=UPI00083B007C|nr:MULTISPECIES: YMGG-like glycine zipper-containing protein [unclassified Thermodesulfovibrio]MDI1471084.1 glycine zipper 2TM domain-containing protein [Thermodesulfovibrio sp. 1176]MDI6713934.1 glycine zipper 2TM domain-containing protein [Thermodesulfovibrio sp.]ODA44348.1 putative lipoprotein [Thermodesulfovibrio sp. N1]